MNVIAPVNFVESVPPNVNSPFLTDVVVVGSNDMPIRSDVIVPWLKRLSVTVGTGVLVCGDKVPTVKSTGPILVNKRVRRGMKATSFGLTRGSRRNHRSHWRLKQRRWIAPE